MEGGDITSITPGVAAESFAVAQELATVDEHVSILQETDVEKLHDYIRRAQARLKRELRKNQLMYNDNCEMSKKCLEHYTRAQDLASRIDNAMRHAAGKPQHTAEEQHCFMQKADGTGDLIDMGTKSSVLAALTKK